MDFDNKQTSIHGKIYFFRNWKIILKVFVKEHILKNIKVPEKVVK